MMAMILCSSCSRYGQGLAMPVARVVSRLSMAGGIELSK